VTGVGYEKQEEKWIEYTAKELVDAREAAFAYIGEEPSHTIPNSYLCERLGLTKDAYRAQRLIRWASSNVTHGETK
jgi:hypothetical protein